jgi:hypothetical protein
MSWIIRFESMCLGCSSFRLSHAWRKRTRRIRGAHAPRVVVIEDRLLEPIKSSQWPPGFFDRIRIDDPAFARLAQGELPPAPSLD